MQKHDAPLIAVVLVNWNKPDLTERCLETLLTGSYTAVLPIVVDNGSTVDWTPRFQKWFESRHPCAIAVRYDAETALSGGDSTNEVLLESAPRERRLVLIRSEHNRGFTGGNNLAIAYALTRASQAHHVFFLNNDTRIDPDCLRHLVAAAEQGGLSVVGAVVEHLGTGAIRGGMGGSHPLMRQFLSPLLRWKPTHLDHGQRWIDCYWVLGTAMLCTSEALRGVCRGTNGYWSDELFMYHDEFDLCRRVHNRGGRVAVCPAARVSHEGAASSGGERNPLAYYYQVRNPFHLARWYLHPVLAPFWVAFYLAVCVKRLGQVLVRRDGKAQRAIIAGVRDGMLSRTGKWDRHDDHSPFKSAAMRHLAADPAADTNAAGPIAKGTHKRSIRAHVDNSSTHQTSEKRRGA